MFMAFLFFVNLRAPLYQQNPGQGYPLRYPPIDRALGIEKQGTSCRRKLQNIFRT